MAVRGLSLCPKTMTNTPALRLSRMARWGVKALVPLLVLFIGIMAWPMGSLFKAPVSTVLLDRHGDLLGATVAGDGQWRFPPSKELPERFTTCLIQFEDRHFFDHHGVHVPSLVRALRQNIASGDRISGGSTLTMQVARMSDPPGPRSYLRKVREMFTALRIELRYTKSEILGLFSANAPFGGNVVGLDAASWRYYGRPPSLLTWAECATLAVLPNAPSAIYPGKGQHRLRAKRDRLLDRLLTNGSIDSLEWSLAKAEPLPGRALPLPQRAPHLLATLRALQPEGGIVHSTLDGPLQDRATAILASHAPELAANEVHNAAVVIEDLPTAEVLAYVGNLPGAGADHAGAVDIVRCPRSTGSLLKPFLYAAMMGSGELLPDMLVADVPTRYQGLDPRNYDERYHGAVRASEALARSLNVPAVRLLRSYGVEPTLQVVRAMGLTGIDRDAGHYGLSLILGGAESDLLSLTNAYGNLGRILLFAGIQGDQAVLRRPMLTLDRSGPSEPVEPPVSPSAAYFTLNALRQVERPSSEGGWEYFSDARGISWKTGTSMGHRDGWAIGLDANAVIGVWTGNASGEGRPGLTGTLAAAPVLFELFGQIPQRAVFDVPFDDLARLPLCARSGHRAGVACPVIDTTWVPALAIRTPLCPYHQVIRVDAGHQHRVTSVDAGSEVAWFTLPPAMEHFYAPTDPTYRPLPPWSDRAVAAISGAPMEMIYPENDATVLLPTELDGSPGRAVFEVAHRDRGTRVHWHLDGAFLGTTEGTHHMAVAPPTGAHTLLLTDTDGHTLTVRFVIVGRVSGG